MVNFSVCFDLYEHCVLSYDFFFKLNGYLFNCGDEILPANILYLSKVVSKNKSVDFRFSRFLKVSLVNGVLTLPTFFKYRSWKYLPRKFVLCYLCYNAFNNYIDRFFMLDWLRFFIIPFLNMKGYSLRSSFLRSRSSVNILGYYDFAYSQTERAAGFVSRSNAFLIFKSFRVSCQFIFLNLICSFRLFSSFFFLYFLPVLVYDCYF